MSRFFHRLVARARGTERQVQPVVRGLFDPEDVSSGGFVEETVRSVASAPRSPRAEADEPARPADAERRPDERDLSTAPETIPQSAMVTPSPEASGPRSEPNEGVSERHSETHVVEREIRTEREVIRESPVPPPRMRAAVEPVPAVKAEGEAWLPPVAAAEIRSDPRSDHAQIEPPRPHRSEVVAKPMDGELAVPTVRAPEAAAPPRAEHKVVVHIEHLEVRQHAPAPKPKSTRRRLPNPAPDLNGYLRNGRK